MRKYVLALCLILSCMCNANKIHWITFIDTTDPNVGALDENARKWLYPQIIEIVNSYLKSEGYEESIKDYYGHFTTPENCKRVIENLQCGVNDIICFYYIGHGTRSPYEDVSQNPFPQLCLAQHDDSKYIPLRWIHNELKNKGARLTITIGMCCNSFSEVSAKDAPNFGVTYGNYNISNIAIKNLKRLFLENRGDIIVTSAQPGQNSVGGDIPAPFNCGMDVFTPNFIMVFQQLCNTGSATWYSIMNSISNNVYRMTYGKQRPFFQSNLQSCSAPNIEKEEKDIDVGLSKEKLSKFFDYLIDKSISERNKLNLISKYSKMFANSAQVKTIGHVGDIVVDKNPFSVFADRISHTDLLLNVVPITIKKDDSGKISTIVVREYYKK